MLISTIRAVVEGRQDLRGEPWRTAAVDELEQCVQIGPVVARERSGERGIEARPFQPSPAPGNGADGAMIQPAML